MSGCGTNSNNINKTFIIEPILLTGGSPVVSACTSLFTDMVQSCGGDTSLMMGSGISIFNADLEVQGNLSATTYYGATFLSGGTDLITIIDARDNFVTGGTYTTGFNILTLTRNDNTTINVDLSDLVYSGGSGNCITDLYVTNVYGCSPITFKDIIIFEQDITPSVDGTNSVGTPIKRFREINAMSGVTSLWTATTKVTTASLDLGLDSQSNSRIITANNSIIQDDRLNGGTY